MTDILWFLSSLKKLPEITFDLLEGANRWDIPVFVMKLNVCAI